MPFTAREIVLAIAIVAILVGSFLNCQVVGKALRATGKISAATSGELK
jgi:hypothetical protein